MGKKKILVVGSAGKRMLEIETIIRLSREELAKEESSIKASCFSGVTHPHLIREKPPVLFPIKQTTWRKSSG